MIKLLDDNNKRKNNLMNRYYNDNKLNQDGRFFVRKTFSTFSNH